MYGASSWNADAPLPSVARTFDFVTNLLPSARMALDVGCGRGDLAALLVANRWTVQCVERDAGAAAACRERGLRCLTGEWPDVPIAAAYDVVLFIHSLHHIDRLHETVERATECLGTPGTIIVTDSRLDVGAETREWFATQLEAAVADRWFDADAVADRFAARVLARGLEAWDEAARQRYHTVDSMAGELASAGSLDVTYGPYLYRCLEAVLPDAPERNARINSFLEREQDAIVRGVVEPMEVRFAVRCTEES